MKRGDAGSMVFIMVMMRFDARCGQVVVASLWSPGFGIQILIARLWCPGCVFHAVAFRLWRSDYGVQFVASRLWRPGSGFTFWSPGFGTMIMLAGCGFPSGSSDSHVLTCMMRSLPHELEFVDSNWCSDSGPGCG